ncbi:cysteine dioxygenase family protein [Nostoc sp. FACHB-152]|uniref:cysteine dioxygenase family protein n=1 Tax=unclassified Nostoc TaxID=2593658 RepID=UPI001683FA65|nr:MULTISPECIES: cysteine dioxygenase family protein [unclassified Nostoc]MBD2452283.1 cysteine dioxygenase family protein [Nostoc sp. FACHB-152]MBD2469110.1 cysteine dioxygenase family protein [Nostoc sp. FACHB-145]
MPYTTVLEPLQADQWFVDSPDLREFVATAKEIISSTTHNRAETLNALEPHFAALLKKENWLPKPFDQPNPDSGLGGGIGQWLLYRSQDRSLIIFSLVIPPHAITPVHDHLSWGLVGLYQGKQEETVYRRIDSGELEGSAHLETIGTYQVKTGDIYHLLPPDNDIHSVKATTVFAPSISIHVMGNDTGSIWRHHYHPEEQSVRSFRSGYSNVPVKENRENPHATV